MLFNGTIRCSHHLMHVHFLIERDSRSVRLRKLVGDLASRKGKRKIQEFPSAIYFSLPVSFKHKIGAIAHPTREVPRHNLVVVDMPVISEKTAQFLDMADDKQHNSLFSCDVP